jgi:hypothetical protein
MSGEAVDAQTAFSSVLTIDTQGKYIEVGRKKVCGASNLEFAVGF